MASSPSHQNLVITDTIWISLGKSKMQILFFITFLIICPFLGLFLKEFNNIYLMRIANNPGYKWPKYSDLIFGLYTMVVLTVILFIMQKILRGSFYEVISDRYKDKERKDKADRMVKHLFKAFYFTFSVFFAYFIAKDSFFLPPCLGGSGRVEDSFKDTPYFDADGLEYLGLYLMIQLGYHFHSLLVHISSEIRNDFMEMLLHHSITVALLFLAYFMNYWPMSLLVLYTHDISDAFVCYTKVFIDTKMKLTTGIFSLCLIVSWAYTRLYVYPFKLMRYGVYENPWIHEVYGIGIMGTMVHVLLVLHVYWFILLIKMALRFFNNPPATIDPSARAY
jgi:TLC domain